MPLPLVFFAFYLTSSAFFTLSLHDALPIFPPPETLWLSTKYTPALVLPSAEPSLSVPLSFRPPISVEYTPELQSNTDVACTVLPEAIVTPLSVPPSLVSTSSEPSGLLSVPP